MVGSEAQGLGLPHSVLTWQHADIQGNLQDAARRARHMLIDGWRGPVRHVLMAHTQDDQAETFLLRLARGSGVDGLAAMAGLTRIDVTVPSGSAESWSIVRPLLDISRAELRHFAKVLHIPFVDDPSNVDPRFDRVRIRRLLDPLAEVGLTRERLAKTALAQRRASVALAARALDVARCTARTVGGDVVFDRDTFAGVEAETQLRLLAAALQFVNSAAYRPRLASLESALDRILSGGVATLQGALLLSQRAEVWVTRELEAVARVDQPSDTIWDNRWHLSGPHAPDLTIRALGETGLLACPDWRSSGFPRASLLSSPAVWRGDTLIAAPLAGVNDAWQARIVADFHSSLVSH